MSKKKAKSTPTEESELSAVAGTEPSDTSKSESSMESGEFEPKCMACGAPIYTGHAIRCKCGKITHQFCFDRHIIEDHRPESTVIKVKSESVYDADGKFVGLRGEWSEVANV